MERRVQLQNQKQKCDVAVDTDIVAAPTKTPDTSLQQVPDNVKPFVPDSIGNPIKVEPEETQVPRKRIKTLLPVKRKEKKLSKLPTELETSLVEEQILDDLIIQAVKEGAIINVSDSAVTDDIIQAKVILEPIKLTSSPQKIEKMVSHPAAAKFSITPEHRRIQQLLSQKAPPKEPNHLKKENILSIDYQYLTHVGEYHNSDHQLETMTTEGQVEVSIYLQLLH